MFTVNAAVANKSQYRFPKFHFPKLHELRDNNMFPKLPPGNTAGFRDCFRDDLSQGLRLGGAGGAPVIVNGVEQGQVAA